LRQTYKVADVLIDLAVVVTTFALIFPAELPDKTFIATLVLSTRYRHLPVWLGVSAAFAVQVTIAVTAGGLLALLPQRLVLGVTATLFAIGAVVLVIGGLKSRARELAAEHDEQVAVEAKVANDLVKQASAWKMFTAEWGDLSQLLTAGLAARTGQPLSVFIGSWVALILVAGIAVLAGRWLQQRVPIWRIRLVSGVILAALAMWTITEFVQ
jgi:Ca2+/H+ antiporter, TMEM165/GDT1 family